jgi:hypothetical protein
MESSKAQLNVNGSNVDPQAKAIELLNQYGSSHFVDAIQVSRFKQMFRRRLSIPSGGDEYFWDDVSVNLKESIGESKI